MAAKQMQGDVFVNTAYGSATESAANTLTFAQIQTNISIFEKAAWVISKMEWYIPVATKALLLASDDLVEAALCSTNQMTSLGLDNPGVIDLFRFQYGDTTYGMPVARDFSTLPGGGKIVAPNPLFLGIKATSVASAATMVCRIFFTQRVLTADQYLEMIDFYRIVK